MRPIQATVIRGALGAALAAGMLSCQAAPTPPHPVSSIAPALVLPSEAMLAAGGLDDRSADPAWEHGRNDIRMGTPAATGNDTQAVILQRTVERLRTTNGRPREHFQQTTRIYRRVRTP